jgi:hypothetical protein
MKVNVNGEIHTVIDLDLEAKQFLSGYVCENGKTYPAGECTVVKEAAQEAYKRACAPVLSSDYYFVGSNGLAQHDTHDGTNSDRERITTGNTYATGKIAECEAKYLSALRRIRNVIRENGQEAKNCDYCFQVQYNNMRLSAVASDLDRAIGGICVREKAFAEWLINGYENDLKILAGVE